MRQNQNHDKQDLLDRWLIRLLTAILVGICIAWVPEVFDAWWACLLD